MSTGYVKRPTSECSLPSLFSLNCVIRERSPSGVTLARYQASSVCSRTSLCTKSVHRSGSRPQATRSPRHVADARAQLRGVVLDGDGVRVDDAEEEVLLLLGDLRRPRCAPLRASCRCEARRSAGCRRRRGAWLAWARSFETRGIAERPRRRPPGSTADLSGLAGALCQGWRAGRRDRREAHRLVIRRGTAGGPAPGVVAPG